MGPVDCPLYNDFAFVRLRKRYSIEDASFESSNIDFEKLVKRSRPDVLNASEDGRFVVRELRPAEHKCLLKICGGYVDHIVAGSSRVSLFACIFLHFRSPINRKNYIVMNNTLQTSTLLDSDASEKSSCTQSCFTLRGASDDATMVLDGDEVRKVHKPNCFGSCCWSQKRRAYYKGKKIASSINFNITYEQRGWLKRCLERDIKFLADSGLVGYSILVSVHDIPLVLSEDIEESKNVLQPVASVVRGRLQLLDLSISNFLRPWGLGRKCVGAVTCSRSNISPQPYSRRFSAFMDRKFVGDAESAGPDSDHVDFAVFSPQRRMNMEVTDTTGTRTSGSLVIGRRRVATYNDGCFKKLREQLGIEDDFLESAFNFEEMSEGGGKGGALMCLTKDSKYLVKEMSKGDHLVLSRLAASYVEHMLVEDEEELGPLPKCCSLMAKFLVHFHEPISGITYVVMTNCLPSIKLDTMRMSHVEQQQTQKQLKATRATFDLKGTADDKTLMITGTKVKEVHKRIWMLWMWCGRCFWTDARHAYYQGKKHATAVKFHVTPEQKRWVQLRIERDCQWFAENGLLDYSLLVQVYTLQGACATSSVLEQLAQVLARCSSSGTSKM
jgi:hypothetical protein